MTTKEVIALAAAGVNLATLAKIVAAFPEDTPTKGGLPVTPTAVQGAAPEPKAPPASGAFEDIMKALGELKESVITTNIQNSRQPEEVSAEAYLASIINPEVVK